MPAHDGFRTPPVARVEGVDHRRVIVLDFRLGALHPEAERDEPRHLVHQIGQHAVQTFVPACLCDGEVKLAIGVQKHADLIIERALGIPYAVRGFKPPQQRGVHPATREPRGQWFELDPQREHLLDVAQGDRRDAIALTRHRPEVAFMREPYERDAATAFAERVALHQLVLGQRRAGHETAGKQIAPDPLIRVVAAQAGCVG